VPIDDKYGRLYDVLKAVKPNISIRTTRRDNYPDSFTPFLSWLEANNYLPIENLSDSAIVEIGASYGYVTVDIGNWMLKLNPKVNIYGVDPGDHVGKLISGVQVPNNVKFIRDDHRLKGKDRPKEPIKVILNFNMVDYYSYEEKRQIIFDMAQNLDEGGLLIIGYGRTRHGYPDDRMCFLVLQRRENHLIPREVVANQFTNIDESSSFHSWKVYMSEEWASTFENIFVRLDRDMDEILTKVLMKFQEQGMSVNWDLFPAEVWTEQLNMLSAHGIRFKQLSRGFISLPFDQFVNGIEKSISMPVTESSKLRTDIFFHRLRQLFHSI